MMHFDTIVIGGGAAGVFSAIWAKESDPNRRVLLLEKTRTLLAKVRISGGGRCNVTHACFDPKLLVQNYPRGSKELLSPFTRFGPQQMIDWLTSEGISLKTEADGRIFPTSNSSETIINALLNKAKKLGLLIQLETGIASIEKKEGGFLLSLKNGGSLHTSSLILATGSNKQGYEFAESLGHTIVPPVPSLFTFNVPDSPLAELSGISLPFATVTLPKLKETQSGPLLITHFGFSGPAVLKLSSFAARKLHALDYTTPLSINWLGQMTPSAALEILLSLKNRQGEKKLFSLSPFSLPKNLWKAQLIRSSSFDLPINQTPNKHLAHLSDLLTSDLFTLQGKTTNKEEFVTAGGVELKEVHFKTMESKKVPHLFFAGEVLDIDGVTGGFNFQNAWTTGFIAGTSLPPAE